MSTNINPNLRTFADMGFQPTNFFINSQAPAMPQMQMQTQFQSPAPQIQAQPVKDELVKKVTKKKVITIAAITAAAAALITGAYAAARGKNINKFVNNVPDENTKFFENLKTGLASMFTKEGRAKWKGTEGQEGFKDIIARGKEKLNGQAPSGKSSNMPDPPTPNDPPKQLGPQDKANAGGQAPQGQDVQQPDVSSSAPKTEMIEGPKDAPDVSKTGGTDGAADSVKPDTTDAAKNEGSAKTSEATVKASQELSKRPLSGNLQERITTMSESESWKFAEDMGGPDANVYPVLKTLKPETIAAMSDETLSSILMSNPEEISKLAAQRVSKIEQYFTPLEFAKLNKTENGSRYLLLWIGSGPGKNVDTTMIEAMKDIIAKAK